jgi:hypothetical protein
MKKSVQARKISSTEGLLLGMAKMLCLAQVFPTPKTLVSQHSHRRLSLFSLISISSMLEPPQ